MKLVITLQIISALLWTVIAVWAAPSVLRGIGGRWKDQDDTRRIFCFMGLVQLGFILRWAVWPHTIHSMEIAELHTWSVLYMCLIIIAGKVMLHLRSRG